jgi:hypothetical protein
MLTMSPTSAAIKHYYEELAQYDAFDAQHELARKTAFQSLLQAVAPQVVTVSVETVALVGEMAREVDLLTAVGVTGN